MRRNSDSLLINASLLFRFVLGRGVLFFSGSRVPVLDRGRSHGRDA